MDLTEVLILATKDYSSKQEHRIADFLGWQCVVASGARSCHPGDIRSDSWLGECKTHVKPDHRIQFIYTEWRKICDEAMSKFRFPVLFVDDGSQKLDSTWCMIPAKSVPPSQHPQTSHVVAKSSLFLSQDLMETCDSSSSQVLKFEFNGDWVIIMRLRMFVNFC